jgi:hypothetical protein
MSLEVLDTWRELLDDVGELGDALCRAIETDDMLAALATMVELRKARAALARVEAPAKLEGDERMLHAMAEVGQRLNRARGAEGVMARWLRRELPGDARLLRSPIGVAVLADAMLPAVWDYETDAVVLVGSGLEPVAELLRDLGQRRIVMHAGGTPSGAVATVAHDEIVTAIRTMAPVTPARFVVRAALGVERGEAEAVTEVVRAALSEMRIHRNTVQAFSRTWIEQGAANLPAIAKWPSIAALDGKFTGMPMVIVAPGPSLAKNIAQLRALEGRAIIAAFSHSLKPVVAAGIVPDLVITVDPQDVGYHFAGCDVSKSCLVNAATVHPSLFELDAGRCLTLSANCAIDDWIFDGLGEQAMAPGGGSVATTAFSLALRWGCDPIVFVGLDLSFPGGSYYVETSVDGDAKAVVDERGHVRVEGWSDSFHTMKAHGGPKAALERSLELPGWSGGTVPSSFMFSMFHRWFVERMRSVTTRVYNCTEGGAFIEGMNHRPLADVLAELGPAVATAAILDEAIANAGEARRDQLRSHVRRFVRGLRQIRHHTKRARRYARTQDEHNLAKTERQLTTVLRPLPFVSLLAQREIERAHDVAVHADTADHYLAASTTLFDTLIGVLDVLEPVLNGASVSLDDRRDHEAA